MNELEARIEQNRKDQERLKEEENKLLKEKEESSRRFKAGQWFKSDRDGYMILSQVEVQMYCLILSDGNRWHDPIKVDCHDVTWREIKKMYQYELTPVNVKIEEI